ncbi:hypothetical protein [Candidatus Ichthyocystis hellenicum]|uniref:hypothetical protein n=1 Tax=Candidatus Ichthyocystis hellenicum TaxID=1561003 RepID=UPI000B89F747|nr:hypothetical protein [Candidatus Ichthyocystis hellenicum]
MKKIGTSSRSGCFGCCPRRKPEITDPKLLSVNCVRYFHQEVTFSYLQETKAELESNVREISLLPSDSVMLMLLGMDTNFRRTASAVDAVDNKVEKEVSVPQTLCQGLPTIPEETSEDKYLLEVMGELDELMRDLDGYCVTSTAEETKKNLLGDENGDKKELKDGSSKSLIVRKTSKTPPAVPLRKSSAAEQGKEVTAVSTGSVKSVPPTVPPKPKVTAASAVSVKSAPPMVPPKPRVRM